MPDTHETQEKLRQELHDLRERLEGMEDVFESYSRLEKLVDSRTRELTRANEYLQAQIEEREQTETALRRIEAHQRAILDASIDRIRCVDTNLRIVWANQTTLRELDLPPEAALGKTCHRLFVGRGTPCPGCPSILALQTGRMQRDTLCKPYVKGFQGETFWDTYCVPLKNKAGEVENIIQIARNITEQRKAEASLRSSEERFKRIFTGSPIGIAVYEQEAGLTDANPAFLQIFGISSVARLRGRPLTKEPFISEDVQGPLKAFEPMRYEFALDMDGIPRSQHLPARRSGTLHLDISIRPMARTAFSASPGYLVQVQDISARKQAEEQIHSLTQEVIRAHEEERLRISRDLHDRVAQELSSLKIGLDTLFDLKPEVPPVIRHKAAQLTEMVQHAIADVRDIAYNLRPPGLTRLGLAATMFRYCEDFAQKSGITVDFKAAGLEGLHLSYDTMINLYRILQESLANVRKHAGARQVVVRLVASFPKIILRIEDDGKGFDPARRGTDALHGKRMGLRNLQERAALLKGRMHIVSRPMAGTRVYVEAPLQVEKNDG